MDERKIRFWKKIRRQLKNFNKFTTSPGLINESLQIFRIISVHRDLALIQSFNLFINTHLLSFQLFQKKIFRQGWIQCSVSSLVHHQLPKKKFRPLFSSAFKTMPHSHLILLGFSANSSTQSKRCFTQHISNFIFPISFFLLLLISRFYLSIFKLAFYCCFPGLGCI